MRHGCRQGGGLWYLHGSDSELDSLTPPPAIKAAIEPLERAYAAAGADDAWQLLVEPGSGHVETARMRLKVLDFLERQLLL